MSRPDEPGSGADPDRDRLDVDAAFADIVSRWGDGDPPAPESSTGADEPPVGDPARLERLFRPAGGDPLQSAATWDDEGHFVPPPPPPLPPVEPRRRLAWWAVAGIPVLALVLLVLDVTLPQWAAVLMVGGVVGGFGYLVATMRSTPPGEWTGDDGAVV